MVCDLIFVFNVCGRSSGCESATVRCGPCMAGKGRSHEAETNHTELPRVWPYLERWRIQRSLSSHGNSKRLERWEQFPFSIPMYSLGGSSTLLFHKVAIWAFVMRCRLPSSRSSTPSLCDVCSTIAPGVRLSAACALSWEGATITPLTIWYGMPERGSMSGVSATVMELQRLYAHHPALVLLDMPNIQLWDLKNRYGEYDRDIRTS
ncbi:hypothetical protein M011DRAFT_345023 [Sporormia fimetaria CBS 119925]|uniref:Uncharacterized protein n=1 Tax=Sporormia fimetaria CBS 119925 TaxID=1340428 RepID=A0A6A6VCL5_9PLEO|nr:hypothetical protein M011DRAFT_345023 [Sporormia fimetaria CBS 119925]